MSERLLSASQKTKNKLATRLSAGLGIVLATVALSACEKGSDNDKGTDEIAECPKGYAVGAREVAGSREEFRVSLGQAVGTLTANLPRNGLGEVPVEPRDEITVEQGTLFAAAVEVFHQDNSDGFGAKFEVDTPENRIDDLSEQFCTEGDKLFISPQTATAIGALKSAGIDVNTPNN